MGSLLLLLADGRFPTGSHAHSGGLEEAVATGRVRDEESLYGFLLGRLATTGLVDSAFAAAAWSVADRPEEVTRLDVEAAARCPSPSLREASRSLGRAVMRAGLALWPGGPEADWPRVGNDARRRQAARGPQRPAAGAGLMSSVALGLVGKKAGLAAADVALLAAQASVSTPAWAATRLLGLDPFGVARCLARLAGAVEAVAAGALELAAGAASPALLPAVSSPLIEIGAEAHARWEVRLFAS
jgi:urease accessory protein